MKEFFLEKEDGTKIQFWQYTGKKNAPTVLYYHGNSYNLGNRAPKFRELIDLGFNVLAPAYDGFGKSQGKPDYDSILDTAHLAVKYLQDTGVNLKNVIVMGESLGSGVATTIAREYDFGGLFLITPYTTIAQRAAEIYWYIPVSHAVKDDFSNIYRIVF
jgi:acetyl esterase/lipase